jgi:hypothetical protein
MSARVSALAAWPVLARAVLLHNRYELLQSVHPYWMDSTNGMVFAKTKTCGRGRTVHLDKTKVQRYEGKQESLEP